MTGDGQPPGRRLGDGIAFAAAGVLHAMVGLFYVSSGLVAPLWAVALLIAVWLGLAIVLWRWRWRGPGVLAIPLVAAAVWWTLITLGDVVLDWTA